MSHTTIKTGRAYKAIAGCALAAGLLTATLGGVQVAQAFQSDAATGEEYQADLEQRWEETAQEYAPEVTTLEDGTQVQRTPYDTSYFQMYYVNGGDLSYNTRYLDADNRGCNACHDDLAQVLRNMDFFHLELDNGLGTTTTVDDCRICHDYGYGYVDDPGEFGNTIHGIHNKSGVVNNCMTCHAATADGQGMQLWDDVKYDVMQGIGSVADVQGEFSYRQDVTTPMFDASWYYTETNTSNIARGYAGEELDMDVFDTWEVTVSGLVEQPFTAKLTDLIDEAPLVTTTVAMECIMNAPGGEAIANMEVTGIPISWLLEKAGGVKDGATAIMSYAPDGWGRASDFARYEETDGYLIFKVNGEYLDWENGFPLMTCWPGQGIPASIRWVNEISVVDTPLEELKMWDGWTLSPDGNPINDHNGGHGVTSDEEVVPYNNPNVAVTHFKEGQVVSAEEPYTFEGYAWATDEKIATVEFSLDRGATWTAFDTSDSDRLAWVYWYFTPDQLEPGAYVLQVRATTESGAVSYQPDQVFFNVR